MAVPLREGVGSQVERFRVLSSLLQPKIIPSFLSILHIWDLYGFAFKLSPLAKTSLGINGSCAKGKTPYPDLQSQSSPKHFCNYSSFYFSSSFLTDYLNRSQVLPPSLSSPLIKCCLSVVVISTVIHHIFLFLYSSNETQNYSSQDHVRSEAI